MIVTGFVALSVHSFLLERLNVPYPFSYPRRGFPEFLNSAPTMFALIYFFKISSLGKSTRSSVFKIGYVFIVYAMLKETLFRFPIMNGICSTAWVYSLIEDLPKLFQLLVASILIVTVPKPGSVIYQVVTAVVAAALMVFIFEPFVTLAFHPLLSHFSSFNHTDIYLPPYGWNVQIPAYITFIEPVIACFIIYANVEGNLLKKLPAKYLQFTFLILMVRGFAVSPFIYMFYAKLPPFTAIASMGQFTLETVVLGVLTALSWTHNRVSAKYKNIHHYLD